MSTSFRNTKNPPGFLYTNDIKEKIYESLPQGSKEEINKDARKIDLLSYAREKNLLDEKQIKASTPIKYTVIKTYLSQIMSNSQHMVKLQDYVRVYSLLFIRATRLQNLMAHSLLGLPFGRKVMHDRQGYLWRIPTQPSNCFSWNCYQELFLNKPSLKLIKQCFLPERYSMSELHPSIKYWITSLEEYLTPPNWLGVMGKTGWYNVVNNYATSMKANIETMIRRKLIQMAKLYVSKLQWNIPNKILQELLVKPWLKQENRPTDVKEDVFNVIRDIRKALGAEDEDYLNSVDKLTEINFDLYVHFIRVGIGNKNIFPLASFGRKYAYLDNKIVEQLFGKPTSMKKRNIHTIEDSSSNLPINVFSGFFDISSNHLNEKRKKTRNLRRRKKQKGRRNGYKAVSRSINIKSLTTDGIGASLTMSKPYDIPINRRQIFNHEQSSLKPHERKEKFFEQSRKEEVLRPIFVGVDTGRAKLYTASIDDGTNATPKTVTFTRNRYYWEIGHQKRKTFENNRRRQNPLLVEALTALSLVSYHQDLRRRLEVEKKYTSILVNDFVDSTDRAIWRMRGYRWKASSLDQAANRLIDASRASFENQNIVIAIGNAKFSSGGKGEKSVPVKGMEQALYKARDRRMREAKTKNRSNSISIVKVDEFRTTCTCCRCGNFTRAAPFPYSRSLKHPSRRLRLCEKCNGQADKLIDRDVNGARNILKVVINEYYGHERPIYLRRPKKAQKVYF